MSKIERWFLPVKGWNSLPFNRTTLGILFFLVSLITRASDQKPDSALSSSSTYPQLSSAARDLAGSALRKNRAVLKENTAAMQQRKTFIRLKNEMGSTKNFIGQGYSYKEINAEIHLLQGWKTIADDGVITGRDNVPNIRNLTTTSILLSELLNRTDGRLKQIVAQHMALGQLQHRLDSLLTDTTLYRVPNDSVALMLYYKRMFLAGREVDPVKTLLKTELDSIERIEIEVSQIKYSLESDLAETESLRKDLSQQTALVQKGKYGLAAGNDYSFNEALTFSIGKTELVFVFYVINHVEIMVLMLLFIAGIAFYLRLLKSNSRKKMNHDAFTGPRLVLAHPWASSALLVTTLFLFFLPLPPIIISGSLWITGGMALSVIIRKEIPSFWYKGWLTFFALFLFAFADNLLLRQSLFERWVLLILSFAGLGSGIFFLAGARKHNLQDRIILLFIGLMVFFEVLALLNHMTGDYNQEKTFMPRGYFLVIVAYLLFWTIRLAGDTIRISRHLRHGPDEDTSQVPVEMTSGRKPFYFYLLFFIVCFILVSRNFYYYQTLFEPFYIMLNRSHSIGAFAYTYKSIAIFTVVLLISVVVSRAVSFFSSDTSEGSGKSSSGGLGSWALLIRVAIITLGVLLAFVSAGIPMDKFAIILGALSVGIGFGLQTLVNNLVCGLIIAFEKPVNVGDIVEFADQTGIMKSIGLRSSVVTNWDGADVIIPNGDLLNQHLVNWTLGNSRRRYTLLLGVAYGTDLEQTRQLLLDLMTKDHRILKNPAPIVLANEFNSSSIDLTLKFWVPHFSIGFDVKSDLIVAIDEIFREHHIRIPFPQQDVHIRTDSPESTSVNEKND